MTMRLSPLIVLVLLLASCGPGPGPGNTARGPQPVANAPRSNDTEKTCAPVKPSDPRLLVPADELPVSFDGGLRVYPKARIVELDAVLLGRQSRPLEFLLCQRGGASHESLFETQARGVHLKRALEIAGMTEGAVKRLGRGYREAPMGERVRVSVRFTDPATKQASVVRVEQWLWDAALQANPEPVGFIFTGSAESYDPQTNRSTVLADEVGNLIALWRDASCLLDNPRESGAVPDVYQTHPTAPGYPGPNSQVTLIFEREAP